MYDIFVQLCEKHGITSYKLCKELGISQGTISNWKNRGNNLSTTTLKKIADYFGVTMEYLMGGDQFAYDEESKTYENAEYYEDTEAADYAEFLHKNPEYKVLFDASSKVKKEDIQKALKMLGILNED